MMFFWFCEIHLTSNINKGCLPTPGSRKLLVRAPASGKGWEQVALRVERAQKWYRAQKRLEALWLVAQSSSPSEKVIIECCKVHGRGATGRDDHKSEWMLAHSRTYSNFLLNTGPMRLGWSTPRIPAHLTGRRSKHNEQNTVDPTAWSCAFL